MLRGRGGIWVGVAAAIAAFGPLAAQLLFEHALGVQGFAQWAFLNSIVAIAASLACLGSNHLLLSEYYERRLETREDVVRLACYFAGFSLIALGTVVMSYRFAAPANGAGLPLFLLALVLFGHLPVTLIFPVFQARGQTGWIALWPVVQAAARLVIALLALAAAWTFTTVVTAWAVALYGLTFVAIRQAWPALSSRLAQRKTGGLSWFRETARAGVGFGLVDLLGSLDLRLMVPLASAMLSPVATAAAGLCVLVLAAVQFFPYVLVLRVLLPLVHSRDEDARAQVIRLVWRLSAWSIPFLTMAALAWYWLGFEMVRMVVRGDYESQSTALGLLGLCMLPLCVSEFAAAPYMARPYAWRLVRWRLEALGVFAGTSLVLHDASALTALVLGFTCGRMWLCLRMLAALRKELRFKSG